VALGSFRNTGPGRCPLARAGCGRSGSLHYADRTGFLVGSRLVATVEHVVDGAASIVLKRNDKTLGSAQVIGEDPARDLALLERKNFVAGYRFAWPSRSPRSPNRWSRLAFGLPLTVTQGSIRGLGRSIPIASVKRR
jgi:S1-C subfamily serine protease